jgi:flagellar P-ring protein FlgI
MLLLVWLLTLTSPAEAARVRDVANLYGVRDNSLVGYGLVTGLNRTGDSSRSEVTIRSLGSRLQGLGVTLEPDDIRSRNVAVVMVTAQLPSGARPGHRVSIEVSSVGDCKSLQGGILQLTPMYAPNGKAYASAQGPLIVGGASSDAGRGGGSSTTNHPTVGTVPDGAVVEVENPNRLVLDSDGGLQWLVRQPDFNTAAAIAAAIDLDLGGTYAVAQDAGTVVVQVPTDFAGGLVAFIARVEQVDVTLARPARVVINERTGIVVMGADIPIRPVAIAHGSLTVEVVRQTSVSQPGMLSGGTTAVTTQANVTSNEGGDLTLTEGASIGQLVSSLDALGVKPRELIQILLALRAAGAIEAEIEVM